MTTPDPTRPDPGTTQYGDYRPTTKPRKRWPWIAGIAAALFVGVGVGSADDSATTPEPEVVTETETVTETVEVVPAVCIDALDAAERVTHEAVVPAMDAMTVALEGAAAFDVQMIEDATARLDAIEVDTLVASYNEAAEGCRQAAQ